jgi:hypothetical protein
VWLIGLHDWLPAVVQVPGQSHPVSKQKLGRSTMPRKERMMKWLQALTHRWHHYEGQQRELRQSSKLYDWMRLVVMHALTQRMLKR